MSIEATLWRMVRRRVGFAAGLVWKRITGADARCPYCGDDGVERIHRKYALLEVRRCPRCRLMFRFPKGDLDRTRYYEAAYRAFELGPATTLPSIDEAREMAGSGFAGTRWDAQLRFELLNRIAPPPARLLDYGSSWGYFVAQARQRGYDAFGYEIASGRARFGRDALDVRILTRLDQLTSLPNASIDVIYTSHVLEHLTSLDGIFGVFRRLLAPSGTLLIFVPNCGGLAARRMGAAWGPFTNEAHTLSLDRLFFERNLPSHGFSVTCLSNPYTATRLEQLTTDCDGDELLVIAKPELAQDARPSQLGPATIE